MDMLKSALEYGLQVEVVFALVEATRLDPHASIEDLCQCALDEWIK